MSNPGVITLSEKRLSPTKRFRVEDNLGESVHFHYNDIRIDLSLEELLYLSDVNEEAVYDLVNAKNLNLDWFDDDFLNENSQFLIDLTEVREEKLKVKDAFFLTHNFLKLPVRRRIGLKNAKKLAENSNLNYRPVCFNDDTTLVYGAGAVAKACLDKREEIDVLRMYFENGRHSVPKRPWVGFLFHWDRKRIFNLAKRVAMKFVK